MIVHLSKEFRFEASHQLPNHDGKCARLHGHSWVLRVVCGGHVQEGGQIPPSPSEGMVMDYADIKAVVQPIIDRLDHQHLGFGIVTSRGGDNLIPASEETGIPWGMVPTSENLLCWIASLLPSWLPWIELHLNETYTSSAILRRNQHELWLPEPYAAQAVPTEVNDDDIPF